MLGVCLFELESGRSPFENTHDDILWTTFKKDKEQFWKWNEQTGFKPLQNFKELFEGMIDPNPEERFNIDQVIASDYYKRCKKDFEEMIESSRVGVDARASAPAASPFKRHKKRKSNKRLRVHRISRKKASVSRKKSKRGSARARRIKTSPKKSL